MARLLIFDSAATVDSAGAAVDMAVTAAYKPTKAVRCFGAPDGDTRNVGFEFDLSGGTAGLYDVLWYMEFYNDDPSLVTQPNVRTGIVVAPPWAREQTAEGGTSGAINHYNVERTIQDMSPTDVRWFPMVVQTLWTRLEVKSANIAAAVSAPRLRIFAHVGGYDSQAVLEAGTVPYAGV